MRHGSSRSPLPLIEGALNYFSEHMGNGDYLPQGRQLRMAWYGKGAELLELRGEVQEEQFAHLCAGKTPETGERLMVREKNKQRVCYFAQISAPKDGGIRSMLFNY